MRPGLIAGALGQGLSSFTDSYLKSKQMMNEQVDREERRAIAREELKLKEKEWGLGLIRGALNTIPEENREVGYGKSLRQREAELLGVPYEQTKASGKPEWQRKMDYQDMLLRGRAGTERSSKRDEALEDAQVKSINDKNVTKAVSVNDLESLIAQMDDPTIPEDLKIKAGEESLKLLNSSALGADAVGAEEAKRLGSFLQYKILNLRNPGSMFGRDMDKFTGQVKNNRDRLRKSIASGEEMATRIKSGQGLLKNKEEKPGSVKHPPGTIIDYKGTKYRVGPDGDSLEPI